MTDEQLDEIGMRQEEGYSVYVKGLGSVINTTIMRADNTALFAEVNRLREERDVAKQQG